MSKRHSLTEDDVAHIIRQLCEILSFMHNKNVIHLDIRVSILLNAVVLFFSLFNFLLLFICICIYKLIQDRIRLACKID